MSAALLSSALRDVPLSDVRGRRPQKIVPTLKGLTAPLVYTGLFASMTTRVVGLHARKTWGLAQDVSAAELELELERDFGNAHDPKAVAVYATVDGERQMLGYIDGDDASYLADELDAQAKLRAKADGPPWAGQGSKGGSLDVEVYLVP